MSTQSSANASRLEQLQVHLKTERYSPSIQRQYLPVAQYFFDYLDSKTLAADAVREAMLADFFRWEQRRFCKRNGRAPRHLIEWRGRYRTGRSHGFATGAWTLAGCSRTSNCLGSLSPRRGAGI